MFAVLEAVMGRSLRGARGVVWACVVACLGACDEATPAAPDVLDVPLSLIPSLAPCAADEQAPLIRSSVDPECVSVGAGRADLAGDWPDAADDAAPVVYVAPANDAGDGAGTRDDPFRDMARALASTPPPATVLLARGVHTLRGVLQVTADVTIRGVGAGEGGTTITAPRGASAFVVTGNDAVSRTVTIAGLRVRADRGADRGDDWRVAGILAQGRTTVLTLRDVTVEGAGDGIRAEDATLCGQGVTVRRAGRGGLVLIGARGVLRDFLIRDGANLGVLADRSALALRTGMIADNARDGVALRGAPTTTVCDAGGACPTLPVCPGVDVAQRCRARLAVSAGVGAGEPRLAGSQVCAAVSTLDEVAVVGNHVTGLRAEYLPAPDGASAYVQGLALAQPGAEVHATRTVVGNTVDLDLGAGGDGVYVGPRARVELDPDVRTEDAGVAGSLLIGNARTGMLVDGFAGVDRMRAHGEAIVSGARVRGNRGPGMYVQTFAVVERVGYGDFIGNGALGLGVTEGARVASIQCEHFLETRPGALTPGAAPAFGDGLSIYRAGDVVIEQSLFEHNQRYGVVLSGVAATLTGTNVARENVEHVYIPSGLLPTKHRADLGEIATREPAVIANVTVGSPTTAP